MARPGYSAVRGRAAPVVSAHGRSALRMGSFHGLGAPV